VVVRRVHTESIVQWSELRRTANGQEESSKEEGSKEDDEEEDREEKEGQEVV
jgi:hypothetical protein